MTRARHCPASPGQLDALLTLASLLAKWSQRLNLTAHRALDAIVRRLLLEAAALAAQIPIVASLADIGSGAGFPGLPIAVLRPECRDAGLGIEYTNLGLGGSVVVVGNAAGDILAARGSESNDAITQEGFATNHAGGILGGISSGAEIIIRVAVKPTPSIQRPQETVDTAGNPTLISIGGRHDPCIVPRLVPVAEAMMAMVLVDAYMAQRALSAFKA